MFDDAALALEEIAPEDKTRREVLGARVGIYMAAKKWDMASAVASHLVKTEPGTSGWWVNLAYATRRCEGIESAEAVLLKAPSIAPRQRNNRIQPRLLRQRGGQIRRGEGTPAMCHRIECGASKDRYRRRGPAASVGLDCRVAISCSTRCQYE